jgi:DNA-binding transcriptional ArsR family regulator
VADTVMASLRRLGQGRRGVVDSVIFSLADQIRIEIQAALHEGPATSAQLAEILSQPREILSRHLKEMLNDGTIGIFKTEKVGNMDRYYYCVLQLPRFSEQEMAAFSLEERQTVCALAVQAASAEALASLWAGKMADDPRVVLAWNRIRLDRKGRAELAEEEAQSWRQRYGIAAEADTRLTETGKSGATYIITSFAYERSRTSPPRPLSVWEPSQKAGSLDERLAVVRQWRQAVDEGDGLEDVVNKSLAHRIRIEIRAALHEGPASTSQLAEILHEKLNVVDYHLKRMRKNGSIDLVRTDRVGNLDQHFYSVINLPHFSEEEFAAMTKPDRQILCAICVQAAIAEAMASLSAGKMAREPGVFLAWDRVVLDEKGRSDLTAEETASWQRKEEIEARSANRRAKSGEPGTTYIITSLGYERVRRFAPDPLKEDYLQSVNLTDGSKNLRAQ